MKVKFSQAPFLWLQFMKRDKKKILIWILGLGIFAGGFVSTFAAVAQDDGQAALFETLKNPAMLALVGPTPVEVASDYTVGAMYAHEMLLFCAFIAMVLAALHVIAHTRKAEDLGLLELIRALPIGRHANSMATIMQVFVIQVLLALFIAAMMLLFQEASIDFEGAFLFGISIGLAGLLGAAIALVFAQVMSTASSATSMTIGFFGLLYVMRASTDVAYETMSNINPLAWIYLTFPFTENNWIYIFIGLGLVGLLFVLAFLLEAKRDIAAGLVQEPRGRARARPTLLSLPGLLLHINRGPIISWLAAFVVMGLAYGSIYGEMESFIQSNEFIEQMFMFAGFSVEVAFTSTLMMVMIGLVAILPIVIVNKLYTEEKQGHFSQIFATKVSRSNLYWTTILLAICASLVGVFLASASLGLLAVLTMGQDASMHWLDFLAAGYNLFPSVLFFAALSALAFGWAPRLGKLVYIYLSYAFFLSYFENLLDLPDWIFKTAIQSWLPLMPMASFELLPFISLCLVSGLLLWLGAIGYKRRDLDDIV